MPAKKKQPSPDERIDALEAKVDEIAARLGSLIGVDLFPPAPEEEPEEEETEA